METLAGKELRQYRLRHPQAWLIDLRPRQAFLRSHLRGAVNVPYETLARVRGRLPSDTILIFYCERGGSAMAAARQLSDEGFQTVAVIGSFEEISGLTETVSGFNI